MNKENIVITRFAPSPSGVMHLGNIRSALMNFLCAREVKGHFILRIEDTDQTRTKNEYLQNIYSILNILDLIPDEGPMQGGGSAPYIQSERTQIYQKYLNFFYEKKMIYRCFKTEEELERERQRQIALKLPPRYQRVILNEEDESRYLSQGKEFVWRFCIDHNGKTTFFDKAKGAISFNLENFADYPITRKDGTFTFLFANLVDDIEMKITDVIRGEEHMSNTVIQSYMYDVLSVQKPRFYHLPLIVDKNGKKLSKRNFGFNIFDLLEAGYLPEAIINYIAVIGMSFSQEILSIQDMIELKLFSMTKASGFITYDENKLLWINKKWLHLKTVTELRQIIDFLVQNNIELYKKNSKYITSCSDEFLDYIRKESNTMNDFFMYIVSILNPDLNNSIIFVKDDELIVKICINYLLNNVGSLLSKEDLYVFAERHGVSVKKIFQIMRKIMINKEDGIGIIFLIHYFQKNKLQGLIDIINYV